MNCSFKQFLATGRSAGQAFLAEIQKPLASTSSGQTEDSFEILTMPLRTPQTILNLMWPLISDNFLQFCSFWKILFRLKMQLLWCQSLTDEKLEYQFFEEF